MCTSGRSTRCIYRFDFALRKPGVLTGMRRVAFPSLILQRAAEPVTQPILKKVVHIQVEEKKPAEDGVLDQRLVCHEPRA